MEDITLAEFLVWLASGGGAGIVAYLAVRHISFLKNLRHDVKRYVSIVLTGLVAAAAWFGMVGLEYIAVPLTWQGWVESVFAVVAVAIITSQTVHGAVDLRERVRLEAEQ